MAKEGERTDSPKFDQCMGTGGAAEGVTADVMACISAETDQQDAALNLDYKRLLESTADPAERIRLRDAERKWIKARDASCDSALADSGEAGGTLGTQIHSDCILQQTEKRVVELERQLRAQ